VSSSSPPTGPYAALYNEIADQRKKIAFFEPAIFPAHAIDSHDWAQREEADARRDDAQRLATNAGVNEFLDEVAAHYRVVCITDHMRCGYATRLAEAARQRDDITVLPGVEIMLSSRTRAAIRTARSPRSAGCSSAARTVAEPSRSSSRRRSTPRPG